MISLFGCAGKDGEDGENGRMYTKVSWSNDISSISLNELTTEQHSIWYLNTDYELKQNQSGYLYWVSSGTSYYYSTNVTSGEEGEDGESGSSNIIVLPVDGEDGEDGRDSFYSTYFSGNTVYIDFVSYSGSIIVESDTPAELSDNGFDKENAIQGEIVRN